MTAPELVGRLEAAGACVVVEGGRPSLVLPPGECLTTDEREGLHLHREAVLDHFGRRRGGGAALTCRECGCGVFTADPADVWACCGRATCPWWRPGLGPEWVARARSYALWRRGQEARGPTDPGVKPS